MDQEKRKMRSFPSPSRTAAEAGLTTWLMMEKLGIGEHLSVEAKGYLANYHERLKAMSEPEAAAATVYEMERTHPEFVSSANSECGSGREPSLDSESQKA